MPQSNLGITARPLGLLIVLLGAASPAWSLQEGKPSGPPPAGKEKPAEDGKKPAVPELPEVLVIGRRVDQGVPVVPLNGIGSRDVFGPERVRETGARDLNDLVQNLPALSARPYNGGEAAAPSFSMRGLPDDGLTEYIHILIDGVPANALPYGWTAFSFMPITTERIYAIDYIRGGHTLRYSPNTVGGVLNFITRPIPSKPTVEARSTLGSFDYSSTLLSGGGAMGDLGVLATYVDRRGEGYRRNGAFDQQDFNLKFRLDRGEGNWTAASFSYMEDEHQAPGGLSRRQFRNDRFANARPYNRFDGFRGVFDLVDHEPAGAGWVEPFAYFSETGRHLRAQRPQTGKPSSIEDWDDESFFAAAGLRGQQSVEILGGTHLLYGGVRLQRDWLPSWKLRTGSFPRGPGKLTQDARYALDAFSAHIDDTFEPLGGLTVNGGVRAEWIPDARGRDSVGGWSFQDRFFTLLPGLGASYAVSDRWAFFSNYYRGFRAPQVWGYAFTRRNADLVFEKGATAEVGTRIRDAGAFSGSLTGWRTVYDDFGVFFTGFYENLGKIVANGVDFELECEMGRVLPLLDGLNLSGSVTVQDSEMQTGPNAGNDVPYAWHKKAAWRARYECGAGWTASLGGVFVGDSYSDEANSFRQTPDGRIGLNTGWAIWDARLARHVQLREHTSLEFAVGATNLLDSRFSVHSRGGFFGPGQVAGAPRQAYFSLDLVLEW